MSTLKSIEGVHSMFADHACMNAKTTNGDHPTSFLKSFMMKMVNQFKRCLYNVFIFLVFFQIVKLTEMLFIKVVIREQMMKAIASTLAIMMGDVELLSKQPNCFLATLWDHVFHPHLEEDALELHVCVKTAFQNAKEKEANNSLKLSISDFLKI